MLRNFGENKLNKQLVIPMSGMGTRFVMAGYETPKPLIEIAGKPIIQHVLEMYTGWDKILFIVNSNHFDDKILNLEQKLLQLAPTAEIHVIAPHKLGPSHAVFQARDSLISDGPIVINYCDFAGVFDLEEYERKIFAYDSVLLTYTGFHPHMLRTTKFAYLKKVDRKFVDIQEKQSYTNSPMEEEASAGAYSFRNKQILLDSIQTQIDSDFLLKGELYTSLTVKALMKNRGTVESTLMSKFFQWGTPEDLENFKKQKDFFTFQFSGRHIKTAVDRVEILAAGTGQRFIDAGYKDLKPLLPLGNSFLALQALEALAPNLSKKGILFQSNYKISSNFSKLLAENNVSIHTINGLSEGQADSARFSINYELDGNCIVGTCDSLLYPNPADSLRDFSGKTLGVWVTKPSEFAKLHPEQFGWVNLSEKNEVLHTWVKQRPSLDSIAFVITGTFIFGNSRDASNLLEEFMSKGITVNDEYYLDSVLEFAKDKGWKVVGLLPEWFFSLGTPSEYETYLYWESLFADRRDLLVNDKE